MMTKLSGANMRDVIQWIIEKNNNKEYVKVKIWFLQMMLEELDRLEEQQAEPDKVYLDNFMCAFCNHFAIDTSDMNLTEFLEDWLDTEQQAGEEEE